MTTAKPGTSTTHVRDLQAVAAAFATYANERRQTVAALAQKTNEEIAIDDAKLLSDNPAFDIKKITSDILRLVRTTQQSSIVQLLPLLLRLRGRPYTLNDHFPMEPLFNVRQPDQMLLRSGRQVSKSTCLSAAGVINTAFNKDFNSLFVSPLFEQCRRFSSNYVRPFITDSPIYPHVVDYTCEQNVLQRKFKNRSTMFFQYCLKDADRVRGIAADCVTLDEVQDIVWDLVPIVLETMSASQWALFKAAGTPKTLDNTIERLWNRSSQAEWVTECKACNHYNIACLSQDLMRMIGKETVVCSKCERPINPRPINHPRHDLRGHGYWIHAEPTRKQEFPGYHTPQVIFPMHFANPRKWAILREKMDTTNTPYNVFVNEVLGEACDVGAKLVSQADLIAACKLYGKPNKYAVALAARSQYQDVAIGVDWGGSTASFGRNRAAKLLSGDTQSYTAIAMVGLRASGRVDVLYASRIDIMSDHDEEAQACMRMWRDVDSLRGRTLFCHDYGGAGSVRETLMVQYGLPVKNIVGCCYVSAPQSKMVEPQHEGGRVYWSVDKARSLILLCHAIRSGFVGLPDWESAKTKLTDFLALVEDHIERPGAANIMRVIRKPGVPDDVAHAINFAVLGLWHRHGYPDFKAMRNAQIALRKLDNAARAVELDSQAGRNLLKDD